MKKVLVIQADWQEVEDDADTVFPVPYAEGEVESTFSESLPIQNLRRSFISPQFSLPNTELFELQYNGTYVTNAVDYEARIRYVINSPIDEFHQIVERGLLTDSELQTQLKISLKKEMEKDE